MEAYRFEDSRASECAVRYLNGCRAILQVDGYAAYNELARSDRGDDGIALAGCWSHTADASSTSSTLEGAQKWQRRLSSGWRSFDRSRRPCSIKAPTHPSPRASKPPRRSSQISSTSGLAADLGKSNLAEAIRYAVSRRAIFERFLTDGRIELDSNIVERAIRPQTITKKNSLFVGSGQTWATIATLLQTAKINNIDPFAWLALTLQRIAKGWPSSQLDALMPWNHAA
ncbi:hypothetical protein J2R96_002047 [Bradyrhizobium elkanii]|nr:hypothetical protein [Bradyrhizobium elkanii]